MQQLIVRINGVDLAQGTVCGTMETFNAPNAPLCPVITAWEGEIVDNRNYTFFTQKVGDFVTQILLQLGLICGVPSADPLLRSGGQHARQT